MASNPALNCRRLAINESRNDFVSLLVDKVREGEVSKEEMTAHVSTLTYVSLWAEKSQVTSSFQSQIT